MSTSYGSLPISNKIGATTDARGEERQDKGDQACEVMREHVCYKMSCIVFVSSPKNKFTTTYSIIPYIQISSSCDSPSPPPLLHYCSTQEPRWHRMWASRAPLIRLVMSAARTQPALTAEMHTSLFAMAKNSSCSPTVLVHLDARPRARRTRSVFEQQYGEILGLGIFVHVLLTYIRKFHNPRTTM